MVKSHREFNFPCPSCTNGIFVSMSSASNTNRCKKCGHNFQFDFSGVTRPSQEIQNCIHCGCHEFYIQKDFSRIVGIGLIVLGCLLAPYTYYISLFALTLLDIFLYRRLGFVIVCYGCEGVYRGFPITEKYGPFQLAIRDQYRFGRPRMQPTHSGPLTESLKSTS